MIPDLIDDIERVAASFRRYMDRQQPRRRDAKRKYAVLLAAVRKLEGPIRELPDKQPETRCDNCRKKIQGQAGFVEWHFTSRIGPGQTMCFGCASARMRHVWKTMPEGRIAELSDSYISQLLVSGTSLRRANLPPALIEAKRAQVRIRRLVNNKEKP